MKEIEVKGTIVSNDDSEIYEWFGIEHTSPAAVVKALVEADGDDVTLLVNSGGGDLFAGNEIYSALKRYKSNVTADITAFAASAATIICCGADKVRANPGAQYMIHNVSARAEGDNRVMDSMSDALKTANVSIANIYRLKTGMDEKKLLSLMSKGAGNIGTWMDAKQALEYGFVDEIIGDDGSLVAPVSIYNGVFATVLSEETKAKVRAQIAGSKADENLMNKQKARLALLKLKGGVKNV